MAGVKKEHRTPFQSRYSLSRFTFREVEKELSRLPALILPLGGCEPYGDRGVLGTAAACAEALSAALSKKLHVLLAPTVAYGCSTAYGAFGGAADVKPRTLTNLLCETMRRWYGQGVRTIIMVDGLFDNGAAVARSCRRMNHAKPDMTIIPFSIQRDEKIRAFLHRRVTVAKCGRTEYGLLSLAAFINKELVRPEDRNAAASAMTDTDAERYHTWRKRGADPDQYRKLFPNASCAGACRYDRDFGRELFGFMLELLVNTVKPFIKGNNK